jgi:predicted NBD/HSP70 family sugar kinase
MVPGMPIEPRKDVSNVTLSVGQSKIGAGAIDRSGNQVCRLEEIATPRESSARFAAIVQQIVAVIHEVGLHNVGCVGVSYPELMPPPQRLIADPENHSNDTNPIRDAIVERVAVELGTPLTVEVLHDAAAAVLGEVSPKGTLPGCRDCVFVVWGTGVASGIVRDGRLYWKDPVIDLMTGEIGLQVIRTPDGVYDYRPSARVPALGASELRLDRWLRGPELARRFVQKIRHDARGRKLLGLADRTVDELDLVDVNRAARRGDAFAVELIESAGREMGQALAPFVHYWLVERQKEFVENIVIGSGVAKLGNGLRREGHGILVTAIRKALDQALRSLGVEGYDTAKVITSAIGYEREFYAFIPS